MEKLSKLAGSIIKNRHHESAKRKRLANEAVRRRVTEATRTREQESKCVFLKEMVYSALKRLSKGRFDCKAFLLSQEYEKGAGGSFLFGFGPPLGAGEKEYTVDPEEVDLEISKIKEILRSLNLDRKISAEKDDNRSHKWGRYGIYLCWVSY